MCPMYTFKVYNVDIVHGVQSVRSECIAHIVYTEYLAHIVCFVYIADIVYIVYNSYVRTGYSVYDLHIVCNMCNVYVAY